MPVPTGTASMLDIQNEFGGSAPISLSEYYGAASGVPTSGTISINDFRGKSGLLTLSGQSTAQNYGAANGSLISVGLPLCQSGDLAIITFAATAGQSGGYPYISINLPSGWTGVYGSQSTGLDGSYGGKQELYYRRAFYTYYKVLSGETSVMHSVTKSNAFSTTWWSTTCHIYRPASAISSVTLNDVEIGSSSTINCSGAGAAVIAFRGSGGRDSLTHSWSAGPTYQTGLWYDSGFADTGTRLSSYLQNTSSPANVNTSQTTGTYNNYVSGFLKVT